MRCCLSVLYVSVWDTLKVFICLSCSLFVKRHLHILQDRLKYDDNLQGEHVQTCPETQYHIMIM